MAKLNVGVIGAGAIGNAHLTGYAAAPNLVKIQALCEPNAERRAEMAAKFNVPQAHTYGDHIEMLECEKLDAVSICTPNAFHFAHASEAIKRGINTLIEKPMVLSMDDARTLKKMAAKKKPKTMVAFSHRFMSNNLAGKKAVDAGEIGEPFMIRVRYAHGGPYPGWAQSDWFYQPRVAGGGALLDMGIHAIDICSFFVGPVKTVSGQLKTLRKDIAVDDNAIMMLDFAPKKCLGYIEVGWTSGPGFAGIEIYGDEGTLVMELGAAPKLIKGKRNPDGSVKIVNKDLPVSLKLSHWPLQMQQWINYNLDRPTVTAIPGLEEGTRSLAVALSAIESSKTGKRVTVKA